MQFAGNAGPDQPDQADLGLRFPLRESVNTVVYVDEERTPGSDCKDCKDSHALLGLCSSHICGLRAFSPR